MCGIILPMQVKRLVTARGVCFLNGRLLCARQIHSEQNGKINEFWSTPGGKLDPEEDILSCIKREMVEETGIEPTVGDLLYVQQYNDGTYEYIEFFFNVENPEDYRKIDLSKTTHGEIEIAKIDFIDPKNNLILPKFLSATNIENDINSKKTRIFNYL